jgi:hypothetical protein
MRPITTDGGLIAAASYFDRRLDPEREARRLLARLGALGHHVSLEPAA